MAFFRFENISIKAMVSAVPANVIHLAAGRTDTSPVHYSRGEQLLRRSVNEQTTSDLGYEAAKKLLELHNIKTEDIGVMIFVSRTPDYRSPATATVLHQRLKLTCDCIAFDINMGGTGFFHGLQAACSLLESINKKYGLIVAGDTSSKQFDREDQDFVLFGDGASAVMIEKKRSSSPICIQTGSAGEYYKSFYITEGGFRPDIGYEAGKGNAIQKVIPDIEAFYSEATSELLPQLMNFLNSKGEEGEYNYIVVPLSVNQVKGLHELAILNDNKVIFAGSDYFASYGDTSGNHIPLLLSQLTSEKSDKQRRVLCAGVGEGISWGIADFCINEKDILPVIETNEHYKDGSVGHDI